MYGFVLFGKASQETIKREAMKKYIMLFIVLLIILTISIGIGLNTESLGYGLIAFGVSAIALLPVIVVILHCE